METDLQSLIDIGHTLALVAFFIFGALLAQFIFTLITSSRRRQNHKREQEIRLIAYDIWMKEGRLNGYDLEHWAKAETIWEQKQER